MKGIVMGNIQQQAKPLLGAGGRLCIVLTIAWVGFITWSAQDNLAYWKAEPVCEAANQDGTPKYPKGTELRGGDYIGFFRDCTPAPEFPFQAMLSVPIGLWLLYAAARFVRGK